MVMGILVVSAHLFSQGRSILTSLDAIREVETVRRRIDYDSAGTMDLDLRMRR